MQCLHRPPRPSVVLLEYAAAVAVIGYFEDHAEAVEALTAAKQAIKDGSFEEYICRVDRTGFVTADRRRAGEQCYRVHC